MPEILASLKTNLLSFVVSCCLIGQVVVWHFTILYSEPFEYKGYLKKSPITIGKKEMRVCSSIKTTIQLSRNVTLFDSLRRIYSSHFIGYVIKIKIVQNHYVLDGWYSCAQIVHQLLHWLSGTDTNQDLFVQPVFLDKRYHHAY